MAEIPFDPGALDRLARKALGGSVTVTPMPGGASTRRYFRVTGERGSAVAMFVPDAKPEEVTANTSTSQQWPFLEVQSLLEARGVRVPKLLGSACEEGFILIEDLGDDTLGAFIEREPSRRADAYSVAVADLARAQKSLEKLPAESIINTRSFDETLLRWELDHFREWGLDARGISLGRDQATFDAIADRIARRIASLPRGFVHRDYQSRNLMVLTTGNELEIVWIDFQDALLGPRVYDLVALLCDSYQSFDRAFMDARLDDYAAAAGLSQEERITLGLEVDVVTVQRKLKDAGRFVFIDRVKKNPSFLPYIDPSLRKVRAALDRLQSDDDMRELSRILTAAKIWP